MLAVLKKRKRKNMEEPPHLKSHVHSYVSNLVDIWQRSSVVLAPVRSQLQVLSLLQLQLQAEQGETRRGWFQPRNSHTAATDYETFKPKLFRIHLKQQNPYFNFPHGDIFRSHVRMLHFYTFILVTPNFMQQPHWNQRSAYQHILFKMRWGNKTKTDIDSFVYEYKPRYINSAGSLATHFAIWHF